MLAHGITPILNVSNLAESFAWFETLGWSKLWEWGDPPGFGAVRSGMCEIFLCENGQGGRGRSAVAMTFGASGDDSLDQGVWMSVWVEDVDAVHAVCVARGARGDMAANGHAVERSRDARAPSRRSCLPNQQRTPGDRIGDPNTGGIHGSHDPPLQLLNLWYPGCPGGGRPEARIERGREHGRRTLRRVLRPRRRGGGLRRGGAGLSRCPAIQAPRPGVGG